MGVATELEFGLVDKQNNEWFGPLLIGDLAPRDTPGASRDVTIEVELPHPELWAYMTWVDGDGPREMKSPGVVLGESQ
jgi:hypothetical protein